MLLVGIEVGDPEGSPIANGKRRAGYGLRDAVHSRAQAKRQIAQITQWRIDLIADLRGRRGGSWLTVSGNISSMEGCIFGCGRLGSFGSGLAVQTDPGRRVAVAAWGEKSIGERGACAEDPA